MLNMIFPVTKPNTLKLREKQDEPGSTTLKRYGQA